MSVATDTAFGHVARVVIEQYPEDAARVIERAGLAEIVTLFEAEAPARIVGLLRRLPLHLTTRVLQALSPPAAARLIEAYDPHRTAALLARFDVEQRDRLLDLLTPDLAEELKSLLEYPPDSAGGLMDPRVTAFSPTARVADALEAMRRTHAERIQDVFLTDPDGVLMGSVRLQDLLTAEPKTALGALSRGVVASVQATASRQEVVEQLEQNRVASLPVVDYAGRLLGVLRHRELMATIEVEATAALLTMVGVTKDERALSSPYLAVRKRLPWLQINLLTAFLAASVVGIFESTIASFTALAVLLPVVAGQSGNTGAQALAVTMRGLALREVRLRHWWQVAGKEITAGAVNGLLVALTTAIGVFIWSRSPGLTVVIVVSMIISMTIAGFAGAVIPMILTAVRQDPAQSSSVILTTVTDVFGFFSFLGIATLLSAYL